MGSQTGLSHSKEFLDLVKSIGEARSKAEEDKIVLNEIDTLKRRINDPHIPKRKMKEYVIRLVYAEMLGHDASFGYIHAVKMAHDDNLLTKRTGYLAVTLLLNEDHDLIILIVNTIRKDLKSGNCSVVCAALNAVCKLINEETVPAVLPPVVELLGHSNEAVRKKAVMALHRFHQRSPSSINHLVSNLRKSLCDNDPGVMFAALSPLYDLINIDANSYKDLVISFVNILKQVVERRLPKSYDYHQNPAPFIQIKLLKILALLGSGDKQTSEHMYTVVSDVMRKCDSTSNIGNAILYECICCVASMHPNPKLLEAAANAISKFLKSDRHNLKYMGIDALSRLIKISPEIAEQHQLAVIECLEDPDDTLKRKTFELLYKMTKSSNVEVIVDRMIDYMININDNHYKTEIASRCVKLAEEFAPSNHWFIQTMNRVFEHAGDLVNIKVAHNLMKLIAEGFGEDDDSADRQLRSSAVESYLRIIGEPKLPSAFLQVICWVFGEYGTADGQFSASYITGKLCDVAEAHSSDDSVKAYAVTAIMKIYSFEMAAGRKVDVLPECQSLIEELSASHSTDLQQRAYELQAVIGLDGHAVGSIMPLDGSCEDIEIDKSLSFLQGYVQRSLEKGSQPYIPENERSGILNTSSLGGQGHCEASTHHLRFEAYELPKPAGPSIPISLPSSTELAPVLEPSVPDAGPSELKLRLDGVRRKWGGPTHSSTEPSTSSSSSSKAGDTSSDLKRSQVQISPEKQKLAASLFAAPSKPEKKPSFTFHNVSKTSSRAGDKCHMGKAVPSEKPREKATLQPPPDLLDMDELSADTSTLPSIDPFKPLEGLFVPTQDASSLNYGAVPDILSLFEDIPASGHCVTAENPFSSYTEPLEKDDLVRQMGVNLANQNLNSFSDLLG